MKVPWKALDSSHSSSLWSLWFTDLNITFGKTSVESSDPHNYSKKNNNNGVVVVSFSLCAETASLIDLINMEDNGLSPLPLS